MFTSVAAATLLGRIFTLSSTPSPNTASPGSAEQRRPGEDQFRNAFEYAALGMALVGLNGRFLKANRSLQNILGYSESELQGLTFQSITHQDDLDADLHLMQQLLQGKIAAYRLEKRYWHKDRHVVWTLLSGSLVRDSSGKPAYFVAQVLDISERKQTEQQALERAEAAVQMRDEFLSVAAHELKTPITALQGFAQVTLRKLARVGDDDTLDREHVQHALQTIDRQAHKLGALVSQLLDVSRIERGRLTLDRKLTNVRTLAEEMVARAQASSSRHIITLYSPCDIKANVDPLRLEQVITNLLDNAVKYSPYGGGIDLTLSLEGRDHAWLLISVTDHGIGIPPEHRSRIFERYYQADRHSVQGVGLGLFISRQIVEQHGGSIHVEFPPQGGTRFVVRLPRL